MRDLPFNSAVKRRAVRLRLNVDLYAKAKAAGIDVSQVAEAALREALKARLFENLRAEIAQDIKAYDAYVEQHGSPAKMLRSYLADRNAR